MLTIKEGDIKIIAEDVLNHCYGESFINNDMIERVTDVISSSIKRIMKNKNKPEDLFPYQISEEKLREIFEDQHKGRDLTKNNRGNYRSPAIAAIWNQHYKTARTIELLLTTQLQGKNNV